MSNCCGKLIPVILSAAKDLFSAGFFAALRMTGTRRDSPRQTLASHLAQRYAGRRMRETQRGPSLARPRCVSCHLPLWMTAVLLVAGCAEEIQTDYGRSRGLDAATSVNGTGVLLNLFEQAGHKVYPWRSLSPRLSERADCIVWFATSTESPSEPVRQWLEKWLSDRPERTLVLVLCDYDAEPDYWRKILPLAPDDQRDQIRARLVDAEHCLRVLHTIAAPLESEWFTVQELERPSKNHREAAERPADVEPAMVSGTGSRRWGRAARLSGRTDWLEGIYAAQAEIVVRHRLVPESKAQTLLKCEHGALIARRQWEGSQLILVANGSFLLNLPLVNHEHRKLAGKLIAEVGRAPKQVAFLEPIWGEPPIRESDPSAAPPTGLDILTVWPTNWILLHLIVAGLVFCFSRWPIFGPPSQPEFEALSDFGRHVAAMAEHLKKRGDEDFSQATLARYKQQT